jgi:Spy/CpxP family protein refolding chaperone
MPVSRIILAALATGFLATAALADDSNAPPPASQGDHHHGGGMHAMFSPQQMAMFMIQQRGDTAGMSQDQRKAYRQGEREKLMAMSDADKAKMKADLQAKWDALPPDEQTAAMDRMNRMRARHEHGQEGDGSQ